MTAPVPATVASNLDAIFDRIQQHKYEPLFSAERTRRENNVPRLFTSENEIFAAYGEVIALSNGSQSALVDEIIQNGQLAAAFSNFDVAKVAQTNPCDIVDDHWKIVGAAMRRKAKVFQMTLAARAIVRAGGLVPVFNQANLPQTITTPADIDQFWVGFERLRLKMVELDMPYLKAITSLLHFLLHVGYDCAKPDSAVMSVAKRLGLANGKTPRQKEKDLVSTVRVMQEYGLSRSIRPSVVDFYMLIAGGQTWARKHVLWSYYMPGVAPGGSPDPDDSGQDDDL